MPHYVVEYWRNPGKPVLDIGKSLETACEKTGVRRITPHIMKHTAITNGIIGGMSITDASSYFSTSVETIQKVYWHVSPKNQQAAAEIMSRPGKPQGKTGR